MSSSFKSKNLFGSGPHRFALGRQGQVMLSWISQGAIQPGTIPIGLTELDVIVRGRLVAPSESALSLLRDAISAELEETPTPGLLIDLHARQFPDMTFIDFAESDRADRARLHTLAYTATFRRIREF